MLSGGSTVSTSLIPVLITFTEQTVPSGRSLVGSSVAVDVPEPLAEKLSGVAAGHSRVNELLENVTGSLKVTVMFVLAATSVAWSAGEKFVTAGAESVVNEKL